MNGADDMNSDNERVSAYLGGMMSRQEAAAFEIEMKGNPELATILERWQANDARLQQAFGAADASGISEDLLARLGLAETGAADNVVTLDAFRKPQAAQNDNIAASKWRWPILGAIAASVVVAMTAGGLMMQQNGGIADQRAFQTAMSGSPSGVAVALNDAETLTPILSFQAGDGRLCREFAIVGHAAGNQGIACKAGNQWAVEAIVKGAATLPSNGEIRTAGGEDATALDATYSRLDAGDPFDGEKEKSFITNGWNKN
jgi:hypothetical protein